MNNEERVKCDRAIAASLFNKKGARMQVRKSAGMVLTMGRDNFLIILASCSLTLSALCIDLKFMKLSQHHSLFSPA